MEFNKLSESRRSIRSYLPDEVPDDIIKQLIYAAQTAPSGGNCQPWHFYIIKNKDVMNEIVLKSCAQEWLKTAPLMIVVCADLQKSGGSYGERGRTLYCIQDTAAAVQNILLCAKSYGLGTCWCGAFNETALADILKLKKDLRPVAVIPVGYTDVKFAAQNRRPIDSIYTVV